jgi:predicted SPOUT superfamily RNA methylase MTH1
LALLSAAKILMTWNQLFQNSSKEFINKIIHKKLTFCFRHALIVFGGLGGLETAIDVDQDLKFNADEAEELFDHWVNVCPYQGSRTIRTEEALLIGMAALRSRLRR